MREEAKNPTRGLWEACVLCCARVVTVSGLLILTGCVAPPEGVSSVVRGTEQDDIPVPSSFTFDRSWEFAPALSSDAGRFRSWTGIYRGPGSMHDLPPWYLGQMRKLGWRNTGVRGANKFHDRFRLDFEKNDEVATITIQRKFFPGEGTRLNVVRAEIHPKGPENFTMEDLESYDPVLSAEQDQPLENPIKPASFGDSADAPAAAETGKSAGEDDLPGTPPATTDPEFTPATPLPRTGASGDAILEEIDRVDQPSSGR